MSNNEPMEFDTILVRAEAAEVGRLEACHWWRGMIGLVRGSEAVFSVFG